MHEDASGPDWLADFDFVGGLACLDFANTRAGAEPGQPEELLVSYARFLSWSEAAGLITPPVASRLGKLARRHPGQARRTLTDVQETRAAFCSLLESRLDGRPVASVRLEVFNQAFSRALSARCMTPSSSGLALAWAGADTRLDAPLWPVLVSASDLLCSDALERVKRCANLARCGWFFHDGSKNRSRRWCSMRVCGNNEKARRHYQRHREKRSV